MKLVRLKDIPDYSHFRIPGKKAKFLKKNNFQTIPVQVYLISDRSPSVETIPACNCKNSSGRTFLKPHDYLVEKVL